MTKRMAARTAVMVLSIFLSVGWLMEVGHLNLLTEGNPDNREVTMNEKDIELHKRAERTCLMRAQAAKELTIRCMTVARHYGVDHRLKKLREELVEAIEAVDAFEAACLAVKVSGTSPTIERDHLAEELGDVENMIDQIKYLLGIVVWVEVSRNRKMGRQMKRIYEEKHCQ